MFPIGLIVSTIYSIAGFSAFIAFLLLGNYISAVWGVISGMINAITMHLCFIKFRNRLNLWYDAIELSPLALAGMCCFTIGVMGVAYHTAIEILVKKPILPIAQSEIIAIVWAFITAKSGIILMKTAQLYSKTLEDEESSNIITDSVTEVTGSVNQVIDNEEVSDSE